MAQTMKVRKGDVVHVLRGKDAGKEGRVIEALPKQGRVVVENINVVKRHRRPRPIQNTTGMGGGGMTPGGIIELAGAAAGLERDGRLPDVRQADPGRDDREDDQGQEGPRSRLQEVRRGDRSRHERRSRHVHAAPEGAVRARDPAAPQGGARARLDHAGAAHREDHAQHGRRRGEDRVEAARLRDRGADDDRRPARPGAARPQVDRAVQAARGDGRRRARDAARRPDVRVPRPARLDRAAPDPRLPRPQPALARRPRQLLARHPRAAHLSRRSTTTTSSRSAVST